MLILLFLVSARAWAKNVQPLSLSEQDNSEILTLIRSCADIISYDADSYNESELMLRVLYTHRNFVLLSDITPKLSSNNGNQIINADFIDDVMQKAFRITPEHPAVDQLTALGYCYNNGYYYYTGGYSGYFATDVAEVTSAYMLEDNILYVSFRDTFTDINNPAFTEQSSALIAHDQNGYYLKALGMGKDLTDTSNESDNRSDSEAPPHTGIKAYLPLIIAMLALAGVGIVLYIYIL